MTRSTCVLTRDALVIGEDISIIHFMVQECLQCVYGPNLMALGG